MADIDVRLLGNEEWQLFRTVRLRALEEAPEAFVARYEDEASYDEEFWRDRMIRSDRIVAERDDEPIGLACLGRHNEDPEIGEVFGLWTAPAVRGEHVARSLVRVAAQKATQDGCRSLLFWAGSDNPSAVAFASSFGFRPTTQRRPVRVAEQASESDADEVAMVLPLTPDPTLSKNPYLP